MLLQSIPNPDYMNGTASLKRSKRSKISKSRFQLNSDTMGCGEDALLSDGMGTTGSLGVSFAAPLTRGGFPGEIFYSSPMPTGKWKDAPAPVMLGTEADTAGADDTKKYLMGAAAGLVLGLIAYKLFFSR